MIRGYALSALALVLALVLAGSLRAQDAPAAASPQSFGNWFEATAWLGRFAQHHDSLANRGRIAREPYETQTEYRARQTAAETQLRDSMNALYAPRAQAELLIDVPSFQRRYDADLGQLLAGVSLPQGVLMLGLNPANSTFLGGNSVQNSVMLKFSVPRDSARQLDVVGAAAGNVRMLVEVVPCGVDPFCAVPTQPVLRLIATEFEVNGTPAGGWPASGLASATSAPGAAPTGATPTRATTTASCGDRPRCAASGPLVIEVARLNVTTSGQYHDAEIVTRIRNDGPERIMLGYVPGTTTLVDDAGTSFTPNWDFYEEATCIGRAATAQADTTLAIPAGATREVLFRSRARTSERAGSTYTVELTVAEIDVSSGRPVSSTQHPVRITGVTRPSGLRGMVDIRSGCVGRP